jgi:hypothetical protein
MFNFSSSNGAAFASWRTPLALKMYRVAKFKQRRQIKSRRHLMNLANIQNGGCTGLSFCWVEQRLWYPRVPASVRIARFNTDEAWTRIDQLAHRFNHSGLGPAQRVNVVAPNIPGRGRGTPIDIDGQGDFNELSRALDAAPGYHVIELAFRNEFLTHLCAIYNGGVRLEFFDPNSGEYHMPALAVAAFFRNLRSHYAKYVTPSGDTRPQVFETLTLYPIGV